MDYSPENLASMDPQIGAFLDRVVARGHRSGGESPYEIVGIVLDVLRDQCRDPAQRDAVMARIAPKRREWSAMIDTERTAIFAQFTADQRAELVEAIALDDDHDENGGDREERRDALLFVATAGEHGRGWGIAESCADDIYGGEAWYVRLFAARRERE